jgi:hypothetical protein
MSAFRAKADAFSWEVKNALLDKMLAGEEAWLASRQATRSAG